MARQILTGNDLGNWGDAYAEGRKQTQDELYRQAVQQMQKNKQLFELEKEARLTGAMPKYNEKGDFAGFGDSPNKAAMEAAAKRVAGEFWEKNSENKNAPKYPGLQEKAPIFSAYPDATTSFEQTPSAPNAPQGAMSDLNEKFVKAGGKLPQTEWSRQPSVPAQEAPLLANPKEEKRQPYKTPPVIDEYGNPIPFEEGTFELGGPKRVNGKLVQPLAQREQLSGALVTAPVQPEPPVVEEAPPPPPPPAPSPPPPAQPPTQDFSMPWEMLGRIADYATTARAKDTSRNYFVGQLPENLQRIYLGKQDGSAISPEEQSLPLPEAVFTELMKSSGRAGALQVRPEVAAAVDQVISGNLSMADFYQAFPNLNPAEAKLFDKGFGYTQKGVQQRVDPPVQQWADKTLADLNKGIISRDLPIGVPMTPGNKAMIDTVLAKQRQKITEDAAIRANEKFQLDKFKLSPKQETEITALTEMEYYLNDAKSLVDSGKVDPRFTLGLAQKYGITGGPGADITNALIDLVGDKQITPEEFNFLKNISNSNLSKLVSAAGTTFTEGFMQRINNLGADASDPARFRSSIAYIMNEINQKRQIILRNAQLNKAGQLGSAYSPSAQDKPTQSQAPKESPKEAPKGAAEATDRRKAKAKIAELEQKYKGDNATLQSKINEVKNRFKELYPNAKGL
jgi:hypothetical protein